MTPPSVLHLGQKTQLRGLGFGALGFGVSGFRGLGLRGFRFGIRGLGCKNDSPVHAGNIGEHIGTIEVL